tara:strand:+ start:98 stop:727 length:630 start_codon:yes stop_codon:yes gene_type:complete
MLDINITCEDNMDLMARYEDNYFDLAIVDPPYAIGNFNHRDHYDKPKWNYDWNDADKKPSEKYFKELKRVSKHQIIWGANYFNCFSIGGAIVWFKDVKHPNMSKCEIASYSRLKKVDFYRKDWSNTDKYNALRGTDIHPCQKPVELYEWLLQNYANKDDKILDTHLGSGSIAIACHNLGYDLTACEIDKQYYDMAMQRLEEHKKQLKLF